jgi:protein SCO1/2
MSPQSEGLQPRREGKYHQPRGHIVKSHTAILTLLAAALTGCHTAPPPAPADKTYHVRGTVIALDAPHNELTLKTDEIPGFMAPMTMSYPLIDPSTYSELHPGDLITATLVLTPKEPDTMHLKEIVVIAQARPDYVPAVQYHVPAPGDAVPDFTVLNQSGHTLSLHQFRGKVLVMTFIYTRCTLSDFCPRMSQNFAQIDKSLQADPKLYAQTHLLTVSFDPAYDTPSVLKSYGAAYTGRYTHETFQHWDFAAPSLAELPKMEQYFDLGVTPGPKGILQHSLATLVIGKDGKVVAFYPTNDWAVSDILNKIHSAAS